MLAFIFMRVGRNAPHCHPKIDFRPLSLPQFSGTHKDVRSQPQRPGGHRLAIKPLNRTQ